MPHTEPHRDESTSAARWLSPDLVRNEETVIRTIFDPHHIESGALSPAAISLDDLRLRGWSVDRKGYTSLWRVKLSHRQWRTRKADINRCYVIPIIVGDLRAGCRLDQNQTFSVTDAALCSNSAHAAILLSVRSGEGLARKARTALMGFLPPYVEVSAAFSNQDKWGWSRGIIFQARAVMRALRSIFPII